MALRRVIVKNSHNAEDRIMAIRQQNAPFISRVVSAYHQLEYDKVISKKDAMFDGNKNGYFATGLTALHAIEACLGAKVIQDKEVTDILDFGCGYGRVCRMLRARWPKANITAYDILDDTIYFCKEQFECLPMKAPMEISRTSLPRKAFDLVWLGSIFTHTDADDFAFLLRELGATLRPNGTAVFSTAGPFVVRLIREGFYGEVTENTARSMLASYDANGFGFGFNKGQEGRRWGWTIVTPTWTVRAIALAGLQLLTYMERGWGGRQDIVGVHKWMPT
jgi:SAM-dependent methyltransferase